MPLYQFAKCQRRLIITKKDVTNYRGGVGMKKKSQIDKVQKNG